MSSKSVDKKYQDLYENESKKLSLANLIIPFSVFCKSEQFIYDGTEKIPFQARHVLYQRILKNEFIKRIK